MRESKVQKDSAFADGAMAGRTFAERPAGNSKEQEVLDVASEYFLRHGFDGMSINAMARSSGISKESIYRYFGSKQELFEAVLDRELMQHEEKLQAMCSILLKKGLREALLVFARTTLSVITTDRTLALRRLVFARAAQFPDLGRHYFDVGPGQAYETLRSILAVRVGGKRAGKLGNHFMALLAHRVMLERECRLRGEPTDAEISVMAKASVDEFLAAFLPEE